MGKFKNAVYNVASVLYFGMNSLLFALLCIGFTEFFKGTTDTVQLGIGTALFVAVTGFVLCSAFSQFKKPELVKVKTK